MEGGGQRHAPAALPPGKTYYPLYSKLGEHQGRCGQVRKISPPPGFDPRTDQPVARRYSDWAILAPQILGCLHISYCRFVQRSVLSPTNIDIRRMLGKRYMHGNRHCFQFSPYATFVVSLLPYLITCSKESVLKYFDNPRADRH
jgi:hypothetical protein